MPDDPQEGVDKGEVLDALDRAMPAAPDEPPARRRVAEIRDEPAPRAAAPPGSPGIAALRSFSAVAMAGAGVFWLIVAFSRSELVPCALAAFFLGGGLILAGWDAFRPAR
jgi:hypothetical protein